MRDDLKPNWSKWLLLPEVRGWEAVLLSLNVEPEKVRHYQGSRIVDGLASDKSKELDTRMSVAKGHLTSKDGGLIATTLRKGDPLNCMVSLPQFAVWALSLKFDVPAELREIAKKWSGTPAKGERWPWGDHETILLRKLADAARRYWVNYDPSDPTTAPTNEEVTKWLEGEGVAKRTAQVMATILRIDGLAPGPRK